MNSVMPVRLVGFAGAKGSGKTTAARYLVEVCGFTRLSFAEPIRRALRAMGIAEEYLVDRKEEIIPEIGRSARFLMQTLGTEWGRKLVHSDIWVTYSKPILEEHLAKGESVVFDDVRYPNEADLIRNHGGRIIHISNPQMTNTDPHSSEQGLIIQRTDGIVFNTGTVKELARGVNKLL